MVVFNDKVFFNKSIVLVLINDNEVFFYGFNYYNKNLKKKINCMFFFNVWYVFNDWFFLNLENMLI